MPDPSLDALVTRARSDPLPAWDPDLALPWADPAFSRRVLRVHLDPATPSASRNLAAVAQQIDWLASGRDPGRTLDLCCGPGLYCHELARRGHPAVGVDVSPAALAWARETAARQELDAAFLAADLADPPADLLAGRAPFATVTCWFGDLHNFRADRAARLLGWAAGHLVPGGLLVLELQPWEATDHDEDLTAATVDGSFLLDRPHHWVQRVRFDTATETEVHGHWVQDLAGGDVVRHVQCLQAWPPRRLARALAAAGFGAPAWHARLLGLGDGFEFPLLTAKKLDG